MRTKNQHSDGNEQTATHGGVWCILADTAGWFASCRSRPPGTWPLTTELTMHYFKVYSLNLCGCLAFSKLRMRCQTVHNKAIFAKARVLHREKRKVCACLCIRVYSSVDILDSHFSVEILSIRSRALQDICAVEIRVDEGQVGTALAEIRKGESQ